MADVKGLPFFRFKHYDLSDAVENRNLVKVGATVSNVKAFPSKT